jgi:hypothetical protein
MVENNHGNTKAGTIYSSQLGREAKEKERVTLLPLEKKKKSSVETSKSQSNPLGFFLLQTLNNLSLALLPTCQP